MSQRPGSPFSLEFFPPRDAAAQERLAIGAHRLLVMRPQYVSVTFGAGGSTRDGTIETVRMMREIGCDATPHLACIGSSRQEAQEKYQSYRESYDQNISARRQLFGIDLSQHPLDGPLPDNLPEPVNGIGRWRQAVALAKRENLSIRELILRFSIVQGHRIVIGTASDIAEQIEDWFLHGAADGFNLKPSFLPDSLEEFVDKVVPELQKRGIFRTEYEGKTLRENLGFKRPANQHLQQKAAKAA